MNAAEIETSNGRLLRLADYLRTVPENRFRYSHWVGPDWKGSRDLSCGTTACALGHAATMPEFQALGLTLANCGPYDSGPYRGWVTLRDDATAGPFFAACCTFLIDHTQALYLFTPGCRLGLPPGSVVSPKWSARPIKVALHIEDFVRRRSVFEGRNRKW